MQRFLIAGGVILLALGLAYPLISKMGLGSLPGDITIRGERFSLYFPVATCIALSVLLTGVFWLLRRFL